MSYTKQTWQTGDTITAEKLNHIEDGVDDLSRHLSDLQPAATSADVGKALIVKTVDTQTRKPTSYEYGEAGGGLSPIASRLLMTILDEAVYGSDQSSNLALLREELLDLTPVSIEAEYEGEAPLVGTPYASLNYTVTVTYDDSSEAVIDDYAVLTTGNVVSGSNTVTISYEGMTTTCTFTASTATVYTITYNLTHVSSSSSTAFVESGSYYNTVLAVDTDYDLDSVTVMMGGADVTSTVYNNLEILIPAVTGNVVITATATAITYLDPLLRNYNYWTHTYCFSDYNQTQVKNFVSNTTATPPYPALHACTLHWKITNISEEAVSIVEAGFGRINSYSNDFRPTYNNINVAYYVSASTQSGSLAPGASVEGTFEVPAGWTPVFTCNRNLFASYELKISGDYVYDTFSGFTDLPLSPSFPAYGKYRSITWYSDDGTTQIKQGKLTPKKVTDTLENGTYDIWYCVTSDGTSVRNDLLRNELFMGGQNSNTDTEVYYAFSTSPATYPGANIWYHGEMTVGQGQTVIAQTIQGNLDATHNEAQVVKIKKRVTT